MGEQHAVGTQLVDLLFAEAGVGLCLVVPDGSIVRANAEWLRSTGRSREESIGRTIIEVLPQSREEAIALFARARAGHRVEIPRYRRRVGGRETWWEGSMSPVQMDGATGLLITIRELIAHHARSGHLYGGIRGEGPGRRFEAYFSNAAVGAVELDLEGRVQLVNDRYCEITGYTRQELLEMTAVDLRLPDERAPLRERIAGHIPHGQEHFDEEARYLRKDGTVIWVRVTAGLVRDAAGHQLRCTAIIDDITDAKRTQEALRASEAQARARALELQAVLDAVPAAVLITREREARRVTCVNRFCDEMLRALFGEDPPESAPPGRPSPCRIVRGGAEVPMDQFPLHAAAATGVEIRDYEFELLCGEGAPRAFLGNVSPLLGADGRPGGAVGAFLDVTARNETERRLRLFARVVETSSEFIGLCTPDMKPLFVNEAGRRMVGLDSMEDVLRTTLMDYFWPEDRPRIESEAIPALVREGMWSGEVRFRNFRTGAPIPTIWNARVFKDDAGAPVAWATVSPDLTMLKQAEAALREANARLTQADQRKDEFLGVLSHELRNPLAAIRSGTYALGRLPADSQEATGVRRIIRRQSEHLTRMVDDLLDVTRISHGQIELRRRRIDLREPAVRSCEDHRASFEREGVELRSDLPASPVWIDADPARISQVLGNLLHNAAKFTPAGGQVVVAVAACGGAAELRVRDTGIGMRAEDLDRVFEPFAQSQQGLARTKGGLGLGLALSKALVTLHGGSIHARSDGPGRGSEFWLVLPLASAEARASEPPETRGPAGGRLVLLIEDNVDTCEALSVALGLDGHVVRTAHEGGTGIAMAHELKPDVVLCDIGLPDMDGYEVALRMRADEALRSTRLIALSGYARPEDKARAQEAGFEAHVAKPADPAELRQILSA
jgi:PAS domain S-box-containing protein